MRIEINFKAGKPAYWQIVDQVKYAAASGALRVGEGLPSIRPLAERLRINRNTVAKAYQELERQGVIETQPGKGSILSGANSRLTKRARQELLADAVDAAIVQAHHLRISDEELLELVGERLRVFGGGGGDGAGKSSEENRR